MWEYHHNNRHNCSMVQHRHVFRIFFIFIYLFRCLWMQFFLFFSTDFDNYSFEFCGIFVKSLKIIFRTVRSFHRVWKAKGPGLLKNTEFKCTFKMLFINANLLFSYILQHLSLVYKKKYANYESTFFSFKLFNLILFSLKFFSLARCYYWKCNFLMSPTVRRSVGWLVGRFVVLS